MTEAAGSTVYLSGVLIGLAKNSHTGKSGTNTTISAATGREFVSPLLPAFIHMQASDNMY